MTTRAEIEAQIAALKAVLKEKEIDPDFTPKELVRWDPTLLGTMLHMKHPKSMPRSAFLMTFKRDNDYFGYVNSQVGHYSNISQDLEMEQICPLTPQGILVNNDVKLISMGGGQCVCELLYNTDNTFQSMTRVPIRAIDGSCLGVGSWAADIVLGTYQSKDSLIACDSLGINFKHVSTDGHGVVAKKIILGYLPLCGPDDNILDHIYVASVAKLPFQTKETIIDKYPLSVLYEEWKADKVAGRTRRGA